MMFSRLVLFLGAGMTGVRLISLPKKTDFRSDKTQATGLRRQRLATERL
jgi:hypothetical protein